MSKTSQAQALVTSKPVTFKPQTGPKANVATTFVDGAKVEAPAPAPELKLSTDTVEAFAQTVATAFVGFERAVAKATRSQMETVIEACTDLKTACGNLPLTASAYERMLGKALKAELAVSVKRGKLTEGTASKKASQMKSVALALVSGAVTPDDGEGFASVYERAAKALSAPTYAYVFDAPKAGAPVGTASSNKRTPKAGGAAGAATGSPQHRSDAGADRGTATDPVLAKAEAKLNGALCLCDGDRMLADKLCLILKDHKAAFIRWADAVVVAK